MAAGAVAFRVVLDPVVAMCGGRAFAVSGVVITGRRLIFMRFPPGGVNGHHPERLFTRVITAGLSVPATMWDRPASGGVAGWVRAGRARGRG